MKIVYTEYFQKSKVFLYPLLGLRKGLEYVPADTYVCWTDFIAANDYKLICVYTTEKTVDFKNFELKHLKSHKKLEFYHDFGNKQVYVFDLKSYKYDHDMFVKGYYSKISIGTKNKILTYFGNKGKASNYIESFLDPPSYHNVYAESLGVDVALIKEVYEICSKPDLVKETFNEKIPEKLELLKDNFISLNQNQ